MSQFACQPLTGLTDLPTIPATPRDARLTVVVFADFAPGSNGTSVGPVSNRWKNTGYKPVPHGGVRIGSNPGEVCQ